jgi:hypothetical protein
VTQRTVCVSSRPLDPTACYFFTSYSYILATATSCNLVPRTKVMHATGQSLETTA